MRRLLAGTADAVWTVVPGDPSGAVYVAGSTQDGATLHLWVAKLSPAGDELWRTELDAIAGASASDEAGGLAVSSAGLVYFATQALLQDSQSSMLYAADTDSGVSACGTVDTSWRWEDIASLPSGAAVVVGWNHAGPDAIGIVRIMDVP